MSEKDDREAKIQSQVPQEQAQHQHQHVHSRLNFNYNPPCMDIDEMIEQELTVAASSVNFNVKNPKVVVIGIENYDVAYRRTNGRWRSVRGVRADVRNKQKLWVDMYGYRGTQIVHSSAHDDMASEHVKNAITFRKFLYGIVFELSKKSEEFDGLILDFSCHGINGCIILGDGTEFAISEIEDIFSGIACKEFVNKPKIMIFDCCVGEEFAEMIRIPYVSRNGYNCNYNGIDGNGRGAITRGRERYNFYHKVGTKNKHIVYESFHPYSNFVFIFSNHHRYTINDSVYGGCLSRALCKVLTHVKDKNIIITLRDLIVCVRRITELYAGEGNEAKNLSAQLVDFHERSLNSIRLEPNYRY